MNLRRHLRTTLIGGAALAVVAVGALMAPASAASKKIELNFGNDVLYVPQGESEAFDITVKNVKEGDVVQIAVGQQPKGVSFAMEYPDECKHPKSTLWVCTSDYDGNYYNDLMVSVAKNAPKARFAVGVKYGKQQSKAEVRTGPVADLSLGYQGSFSYNPKTGVIDGGLEHTVYNSGPANVPAKVTLTVKKNMDFWGQPKGPNVTSCPTVTAKKVVCKISGVPVDGKTTLTVPTKILEGKAQVYTGVVTPINAWDDDLSDNAFKATTNLERKPSPSPTQSPTQAPTTKPSQKPTQQPTQSPTQQPTQQPTQEPTQQPTQTAPTHTESLPTKVPAGLSGAGNGSDGGPGAGVYGGVAAGLMGLLVLAGAFLRRRGNHQA